MNVLLSIREHFPDELVELEAEREQLLKRLLAVNQRIATVRSLHQIALAFEPNGTGKAPDPISPEGK